MKNIETLAYTRKGSGEFVLHGMSGPILLKSGEKIASIANDKSKFYISSKEDGKLTIYVYQID
jgi:hypothetical protein